MAVTFATAQIRSPDSANHPFLGDGMIHGIRLRDGNAEWYRNRYVQTPFVSQSG